MANEIRPAEQTAAANVADDDSLSPSLDEALSRLPAKDRSAAK